MTYAFPLARSLTRPLTTAVSLPEGGDGAEPPDEWLVTTPTIFVVEPVTNPPAFDFGLDVVGDDAVLEDDVLRLRIDSGSTYDSDPLTLDNLTGVDPIGFATGSLSVGNHTAEVSVFRSAVQVSAWSTADSFEISAGDVTAPTITSASTANCAENVTLAHSLTADEVVTWSIVGGVDASMFEISGSTLRWTGNGTKDYEAPDDTGTNNTYVVTVRATDGASNYTDQSITITVTDAADGYVENALHFTSDGLYKTNFNASNVDDVLFMVSFVHSTEPASALFASQRVAGSYDYAIAITQTSASFVLWCINASDFAIVNFVEIMNAGHGAANGDRITIACYVNKNGNYNAAAYIDGSLANSVSSTHSGDGSQIKLNGTPFALGGLSHNSPPTMDYLMADVYIYDARIWGTLPAPVTVTSDIGNFINGDGTTKDPTVANTAYGTPLIQMPATASDANSLVNLGSAGAFDSKQGTVT